MKEHLTKIREFVAKDWTPAEKCLAMADILLLGVLIGWLTSPFKNGIHLFSENSWDITGGAKQEEPEEEEEEEVEE